MAWFRRKKVEERAEDTTGYVTGEETLIRALIGATEITKNMAMDIPAVKSCVTRIGDTVASLPIKLYKVVNGDIQEVTDDYRLFLLNHDTKDKLTANQFRKAIVQDYFLGKGGYAYIEKSGTQYVALHYVDEEYVTVTESTDPVYKTNEIRIQGIEYKDFELLKVLRNTKNGASGTSIIKENPLSLSVGYYAFEYENSMLRKGGSRKGFITSENKLEQGAIDALKEAYKNLYSNNNEEKVVILNKGLKFQEAANSSVDMQLNQNKESNTTQLSMLFNVPSSILKGNATDQEKKSYITDAVMPVLNEIESSLDRDLLTEQEKEDGYYFAFDTKELTRGNIKERYEAYAIALDRNFMQIDEVRRQEDMPDIGLKWVRLGLQDVLLNPETMEIYTPNTGQWQSLNKGTLNGKEVPRNEN